MSRIHANNFSTTINGAIDNSQTTVILNSVTGFPVVGGGVTANITLQNGSDIEIMTVTARSSFTLTVTRASEGTTAKAFADGSMCEIRPTADSVDRKQDLLSGLSVTTVTPTSDDIILIQDDSDGNNLKGVLVSDLPGGGGAVSSVNSQTGAVVLDADDIDDTATTKKFTTATEITKLSGIETAADVTDETNVIAALSGATTAGVTPAANDKILLLDDSDSDNLKHALFSTFGGGGGGTTLLSVQTASSSSLLAFDSSVITSTYTNYIMVMQGLKTSATTTVNMIISVDNGATDAGGGDWYNMSSIDVPSINGTGGASTITGFGGARVDAFRLNPTSTTNNSTNDTSSGVIWVNGPALPACNFVWDLLMSKVGGYVQRVSGCGQNISGYTPPINYIKFVPASGNFTSGTISLYGIQKV